jgi:hypothetical protein
MMGFAALVLALLALSAAQEPAAPQPPQAPRSTFRSNVDLVPVDVNVVDRSGRPVSDLRAEDFTLAVDGRPRRIASAQFISVERAMPSEPPKPKEYNSNADAAGGRLVMLVIDSGNIGAGRGKTAIEAAKRFIRTLNRADRVGLVTIPGAGPQIEWDRSGWGLRKPSRSSETRRPRLRRWWTASAPTRRWARNRHASNN